MVKTILIVDDFESSLNILEKSLEKAGYLVLKSGDGQEALTHFDGRDIDLVITDLNMPNMDGISLVKAIRANTEYKFTPVILLTTKANQQEQAKEAGVTSFMQKPFQVEALLANVRKIVR